MLSREEFNQKQAIAEDNARRLEAAHDRLLSNYKQGLQEKRIVYDGTLDAILNDISGLESDPAHQCIADMHAVSAKVEQQEALLEYVMTCVRVEELLSLIQAQSTDLSTVGMALDALEQLLLIFADREKNNTYPKLKVKLEKAIKGIEEQLAGDFKVWMREVMERVKWPAKPKGEDLELLLLTCQSFRLFELVCGGEEASGKSECVEMLTEPLAAQFHFHFSLDKPTNRLDKPEWALDYIMSVIQEHNTFFMELEELIPSGLPHLFIRSLLVVVKERFMAQRDAIMDNLLLPVVVESVVSFSEQLLSDGDLQYPTACTELLSVFLQTAEEVDDWITMEQSRLLDAYEDAFASLPIGHLQYNNIEPIVDFLQTHFAYLRSLSVPEFQSQLLVKVTLPMLERLLQKLEFDIPAFLSRDTEVQQCAQVHGLCAVLRGMIGVEWGEDLAMITLANTDACKDMFSYDPSVRVGTVFWKAVDALSSIEAVCVTRLYGYIRDATVTMLSRWSSAMHYSKINDGDSTALPDSLRQALVEIPTRFGHVKEYINAPLYSELFHRFLADMEDVIYGKLVLRNYFTTAGAVVFAEHLSIIDSVLCKVHHNTDQPKMRDGKLQDCVILLSLSEEEGGTRSAMVLKRLLQNDKLAEATRVLHALGVCRLTLAECEQVLASRRL